jgi:hypothetical protein
MIGRPEASEAGAYYFTYIDQIPSNDICSTLETQLEETLAVLAGISEEQSLLRYAPGKWSIRELWNHVNDTERAFAFRALWFARGFDTPLPGYDQNIAAAGAKANDYAWARHVEEFRAIRRSTVALFNSMPAEAWMRSGIASDNPFTVRSLAYITAGHVAHHLKILTERYVKE